VQREARDLSQQLNVAPAVVLDQTLADVADASKPRASAALRALARLRPDEASRNKVAQALNAPLLDSDLGLRRAALDAVRVWGSRANTATLLKVLATRTRDGRRDCEVIELLGSLQDPAAAPALAEGLTRREETDASVKALVALGSGRGRGRRSVSRFHHPRDAVRRLLGTR